MKLHFYRMPALQVGRPFDFCLDTAGDLWESYGSSLIRFSPRTAEAARVCPKALAGRAGNSLARLGDALVMFHFASNDYTAIWPRTGESERFPLLPKADGGVHDVWFCLEVAGKVLAFDRGLNGAALILDHVGNAPRRVSCPFGDREMISGVVLNDGRVMIPTAGEVSLLLFEPAEERFLEEIPSDFRVSFTWGAFFHEGRAYIADTSGGRLLLCDLERKRWLDPVPTPDYGQLYGYIGKAFQIGSRAYFNLDTWKGHEGIDRRTHKLSFPPGYRTNTVDGRAMRFLDRLLVYDAASGEFDYLASPPQPDGVAELCYTRYQDGQVFITGHVIPVRPGEPLNYREGDYCVWQSLEAEMR